MQSLIFKASVYLQHFNEQIQALVLNKMAAGRRRFICEVPERAQRKFQRRIHDVLVCLLTHNVQQLLQAGERACI